MEQFTVDVGNADIKAVGDRGETRFMHALKRLSDSERAQVQQGVADGLPSGYAIVNDTMYAYGEIARKYVTLTRAGAQRYERDYYGVLMAIALAELGASGQVDLMASYAPRDMEYREELILSATGAWRVRVGNKVQAFSIISVTPFDEPFGGFCRYILNKNGTRNKSTRVTRGDLLVLDPGGFTTDAIIASGEGVVDFNSASSIESGAENVLKEYERLLRALIPELRMTTNLSRARLQRSLIEGTFSRGNKSYSTKSIATQAKAGWVSDILQLVARFGLDNYDAILLTGGGGAMIEVDLRKTDWLRHMSIQVVDGDDLQMANARGGHRFGLLLQRVGEV